MRGVSKRDPRASEDTPYPWRLPTELETRRAKMYAAGMDPTQIAVSEGVTVPSITTTLRRYVAWAQPRHQRYPTPVNGQTVQDALLLYARREARFARVPINRICPHCGGSGLLA